ncbi:MAG: TonB-dependent receptor plug domain-containing protein, partial [Pseudomonadota bacterium]
MADHEKLDSRLGIKAALSFSVGMTALMAGAGTTAVAQEAEDTDARRLSTITITATKREQTLQDVPVAVSVVDDETIEKAEIQDLNDLQSVVPSLRVGQLQSSANTNFIIRGFGNGANNVGIEPSVGVFVDGVYRSRSAAQISDLPNLQRVEVLRGPQSTLFGKNASAGVISIVTRKPQFETQGSVEATLGNFNAFRGKADITGPISENVAFSLAGNVNTRDGYAEDIATGEKTNERNRWGIRGELLFAPSETLELRLIGDYDEIDEVCCVAGNLVNGPTGPIIGALGGAVNAEDPFSYEVFGNFASENEITNSGISLQIDKEFSAFDVTTITAFRNVESLTNQDSDFTSADLIGFNENDGNIDTFTQEVRFTSNNPDSNFDWMVGGFYFDESVEFDSDFQYGADFRGYADFLSGGALGLVEGLL